MQTLSSPVDAVVVGGGAIGLAAAWRAGQAGVRTLVVDPEAGSRSSSAAAGMLAPVSEATYEEEALLDLALASAERYPGFVAGLEQAAGCEVGYRACGTLFVARDHDDLQVVEDLHDYQARLGLEAERLSSRQCRGREPLLAAGVRGGLHAPGDHAVDNRRLVAALRTAVDKADDVALRPGRVERVIVEDGVATGVELDDGERVRAGSVVVAAGAWSAKVDGLPREARPPVRPVRGELIYLRARGDEPFITHNVRAVVRGARVYLVSRGDGRYVVGATVEEAGYDTAVTAGGVWELLRDAREVLPAVTELQILELVAGLRPGSPDNAPILGPTPVDRLWLATGHFRNGILLTPVTADAIAACLTDGALPDVAEPFTLARFASSSRGRFGSSSRGRSASSRRGRSDGVRGRSW